MKKIKFIGLLIILLGLFFSVESKLINIDAFDFTTVCQLPLTVFSDGSSTFNVSFPPGGGTTCDTLADCPTITLPDNATIFSMKVDMKLTDPASEIGTPYIWIPRTGSNQLVQLRTSDGSEVQRYGVISDPSRVSVMPGGDVWVASRNASGVSRLSPLIGGGASGGTCGDSICGSDENIYSCLADCTGNLCGIAGITNCEEYEVLGNFVAKGKAKGVTYGSDGNIYVGDYDSAIITKFTYSGGVIVQSNIGNPLGFYRIYGMIGDPYGYIWMVAADAGGVNRRIIYLDINTNAFEIADSCTLNGSNHLYGIGMDNEGNAVVNNYGGGGTCKIGGVASGVNFGKVITTYAGPVGSRGVAVDGNNNVWIGNSMNNNVYVYSSGGMLIQTIATGYSDVIGVAIDFDNNAWVASNGSGHIIKYGAVGGGSDYLVLADVPFGGSAPKLYNYSDMTGLRTVPKSITIGSSGISIPLFDTGTFEICSDPSAPPLCSDSSDCDNLFLPTSCASPSGFCEIPLKIFSMQAGDYTLTNLEVVYGKRVPVTTGGLVPCGREWNDAETSWDDTDSCNPCYLIPLADNIIKFLLEIVSVLAILFIVIGGMLYIFSAGNSSSVTIAKLAITKSILGFTIVLIAWIIINVIMVLFGFNDPLGDGSWKIFNCVT